MSDIGSDMHSIANQKYNTKSHLSSTLVNKQRSYVDIKHRSSTKIVSTPQKLHVIYKRIFNQTHGYVRTEPTDLGKH